MVDSAGEVEDGRRIKASLSIDETMPFFAGHFPGDPIMPGVLITEGLAQTSGIILGAKRGKEKRIFYLASSSIKFTRVVRPPAKIVFEAELTREFGGLFQFNVEASVGFKTVAKGSLVLAEK